MRLNCVAATARGIVDIDENAPDAERARLNSAGAVGIRFNLGPPNRPRESGLMEKHLARLQRLDARCAEMGWQLDILSPSWLIIDMLDVYRRFKSTFTLAHFGMFLARDGAEQPGLKKMTAFLHEGSDRCHMKLTATYRMATAPTYADASVIAHALIEAAPDRIIYGSDYPYWSHADKVNSISLFNLVAQWMPDAATRQKVQVDNPARLFGFKLLKKSIKSNTYWILRYETLGAGFFIARAQSEFPRGLGSAFEIGGGAGHGD